MGLSNDFQNCKISASFPSRVSCLSFHSTVFRLLCCLASANFFHTSRSINATTQLARLWQVCRTNQEGNCQTQSLALMSKEHGRVKSLSPATSLKISSSCWKFSRRVLLKQTESKRLSRSKTLRLDSSLASNWASCEAIWIGMGLEGGSGLLVLRKKQSKSSGFSLKSCLRGNN